MKVQKVKYGKFDQLIQALRADGVVILQSHFIKKATIDTVEAEWLKLFKSSNLENASFLSSSYKTLPKALNAKGSIALSNQLKMLGDKVLHFINADLKLEPNLDSKIITQYRKVPNKSYDLRVSEEETIFRISTISDKTVTLIHSDEAKVIEASGDDLIISVGAVLTNLSIAGNYPSTNIDSVGDEAFPAIQTNLIYRL